MKIGVCMIVDDLYPSIGGVQIHTLHLARSLVARGVDVFVITRHIEGTPEFENVDGLPIYRIRARSNAGKLATSLAFTTGALRVMAQRRDQFEIIHSHKVISPATIGLLGKALLSKKLIINPHSTSLSGALANLMHKRRSGPLRLAWMRRAADRFVAISRQVADDLTSLHIPADKIIAIPNGLDTGRFSPVQPEQRAAQRRALHLPSGSLVTFAGRLDPVKQVSVLLQAWPAVLDRVPGTRLLILGDGPQRPALQKLAGDLGIDEHVLFPGFVDDVAGYLQCSDLFVLPSRSEALPVALLEAMACAVPAIASNVGGIPDIVRDGVNGRLVPSGDVRELANAIIHVLDDSALRHRLGRHARADILQEYTMEQVVDRFIALYQSLLQPQGR